MADSNDIQVKMTFDDSDFTAKFQAMQAQLDSANSSASNAADGLTKIENSAKRTGSEVKELEKGHSKLSEAMEQLGNHSRTVEIGLNAIGLKSGEAAAKVEGLTEAFVAMESAVPAVLAVAAAGAALFAAFDFIKDGVEGAEKMQDEMESLGASVETMGGNWDNAKEGIEKFLTTESMASGFTKSELVPALNNLVTAGNDVHDSQIMLSVAEEAAIAKHRSVQEVTQMLIEAENGRAKGLLQLDGNLRKVIDSHGKLSDVLKVMHKDFEKALEDDKSLERAHARLKVEQEAVAENIGNMLLPMLTSMSYAFLGALKNAEELGKGIADVFAGIGEDINEATQTLGNFANAMGAAATGNWKGAADQWKQATTHKLGGGQSQEQKGLDEIWKELSKKETAEQTGRHMAGNAVKLHEAMLDAKDGLTLDQDHDITNHKDRAKKAKNPVSLDDEDLQPLAKNPKDGLAEQQKKLETSLQSLTDSEQKYKDAVKLAGDADEKDTAIKALRMKQIADLNMASFALAEQDKKYKSEVSQLTHEQTQAISSGNGYEAQIRSITAAVNKSGTETSTQKDELKKLHAELENAKTKSAEYGRQIDQLNGYIDQNTKKIRENGQAVHDSQTDAAAEIVTAKESLDTAISDSNDKLQESIQTSNMTVVQKWNFYSQKAKEALATVNADLLSGNMTAEAEDVATFKEYLDKKNSAVLDALKQQQDAAKKEQEEELKMTDTFVDTFIVKHEGIKSALKSILDDITKMWTDSFTKMIAGSSGMKNIFGGISGLAGGSTGATNPLAAMLGGAGGTTPKGTAGDPVHVSIVESGGVKVGGGNAIPVTPNSDGTAADGGGADMDNSSFGDWGDGSSSQPSQHWGSGRGGGVSAALSGASLGGLAGSFFGENSANSQVGGALGGIAAALTSANPLAGAVLSVVGGLIGGLFGNHNTPQDTPDQNDQAYAQDTENLSGGVADNGTLWGFDGFPGITPSTQYSPYAGNQDLSQQMATYIANVNKASLNSTQSTLLQQIQALNPNDIANGFAVANESQGVDTLNSGKQIAVATYDTMLANFETMMNSNNANTPEFSLQRINGGATSNLAQISANGLTTVDYFNPNNPLSGNTSMAGAINVTITNTGTVVGANGMQQLAQTVAQEINTNLTNGNANIRYTQ